MAFDTLNTTHSAIWWKGKVNLDVINDVDEILTGKEEVPEKKHVISPIEDKLVPYNPFDFYYPDLRTGDRRAISLYHRFMAVNPLNLKEVQNFCEEFGVFGNPKKTWEEWNVTGTSEFWPYQGKSDDPLSNRMATKSRTFPHPNLCVPMSLHEFQLEHSAMREAFQHIYNIDQHKTPKNAKQDAREILSERLAGELTKIGQRPRWDQTTRRWTMHWDSLSLMAIMYQMLLFDLLGPGKNVRCEKCGNPFLAEHPRTQYCSDRCRNTYKKARQRKNKQKAKIKNIKDTGKSGITVKKG